MRLAGSDFVLSATDLSNFLSCRHRTALEMAEARGGQRRPFFNDPLLEGLGQRWREHEQAYVASLRAAGLGVIDLSEVDREALVFCTVEEMRAGADVIVQGALADGH